MLKRLRAATLPCVLTLSLLGIPQITIAQSIQELLQQGITAHEAGKYTEAERIFRQAISLNPDDALAYYNLGIVLDDQGKLDEAIAAYRKAISLNPDDADAYNNLGLALYLQGKLDEAIAAYRKAISLNPDDALAYYNLGIVLDDQGKLDEAIAAYRKAISLNPDDADAYNNLGLALYFQGKLDEAIAAYRKAISLKPDGASPLIGLGIVLNDQGKLDEAIGLYRKALSLPDEKATPASAHTLAHNAWGQLLEQQGKLEEAIAEYKRAIAIDPKFATAQNNLKEAERLLAIKLNPPLANIDDRQYLPSEREEPLVTVLRSTVRIIVADSPERSPEQNSYPGTGWVIKKEKTTNTVWIVTNRHVISDSRTKRPLTKIKVEFFSELPEKDRFRHTATIVQMTNPDGRNLDLAILKVTGIPDDIKALNMRPGRVRRLTSVIVIGHPYNRHVWYQSKGTITNQDEILSIDDANFAEGSSGGPVIDEQTYEVIGMVFGFREPSDPARPEEIASLERMRGTEGVGVAYHIDVVIRKLQEWQILPK